ncbi:MAG: hypothetical protein KAJ62_04160 [Desulfobacteraceae bacterium]|nr:hypothetical protein [Desulfobacteraceae bacterium]
MKTPETIELKDPEQTILLNKDPFMPMVLVKGLLLSMIRPSIDSPENIVFNKFSSSFDNIKPDLNKIAHFKKICGYPQNTNTVPMLYLQSLFIGQFGKYITSSFFPLLPLGLIHTKQKIYQARKINQNEILNTKFSLDRINIDEKGLEITFLLEVISGEEVVWKGVTTTLSKSKKYKKTKKTGPPSEPLTPFTIIDVPGNIGRQYAKASGDYNPHHLSAFFAKLFGFKRAIAHGMWSLAKSIAEIENQFTEKKVFSVDVSFKRPLLLPGTVTIGAAKENNAILFELRDSVTKMPHLAGSVQTR